MQYRRTTIRNTRVLLALTFALGMVLGAGSPLAADRTVLGELFSADN